MDVKSKIITQFVRDLSFENPNGPGSFQPGSDKPAINANIDVKAQNRKGTDVSVSYTHLTLPTILLV